MSYLAAAIAEVEAVLVYFTLPGNFWHLIPEWMKEPNFANTSRSGRIMAERSAPLFNKVEMASMARVIPDLMAAGMHPAETFFLVRNGGTRRVRVTMRHPGDGESLTDEQLASLAPLWERCVWDVKSHRTSPTQFLPEHINIVAGNPFRALGGGFEAVRVREGKVCIAPTLSEDEELALQRSVKGSLTEL